MSGGPTEIEILAAIARDLQGIPASADRAAMHREMIVANNALVRAEADRRLTLADDPRGLETAFARMREATS